MSFWIYIPIGLVLLLLALYAAWRFLALKKNLIQEPGNMPTDSAGPLDFTMTAINGTPAQLAQYKGKVVLLVNVASQCGLTSQYAGLQALYEKYRERGLVIIGFPANNFGAQEPGTESEIKSFCETNYGVTFPMMSKISVKGPDKHALYRFLTEPPAAGAFAGEIGWNFAKFLIDRSGHVMARFGPATAPLDGSVVGAVEKALG